MSRIRLATGTILAALVAGLLPGSAAMAAPVADTAAPVADTAAAASSSFAVCSPVPVTPPTWPLPVILPPQLPPACRVAAVFGTVDWDANTVRATVLNGGVVPVVTAKVHETTVSLPSRPVPIPPLPRPQPSVRVLTVSIPATLAAVDVTLCVGVRVGLPTSCRTTTVNRPAA